MFCDIQKTRYGKKLISQVGKRNAKQFGMALDTERWKRWFGKGKTVTLENGYVAPFINPLMQVINGEGKTYNLLERFKWNNIKEVEKFFSTVQGITLKDGVYSIEQDDNRFINQKLIAEVQRIYPSLINREDNTFTLNTIEDSTPKRFYSKADDPTVQYDFRFIKSIQDNAAKIDKWAKQIKNEDEFWNKIQKDLQIPKQQLDLLRNEQGNSITEKLISFLTNYSYVIEINTAKEESRINYTGSDSVVQNAGTGEWEVVNDIIGVIQSFKTKKEATDFIGFDVDAKVPTQHYADLTVLGGVNYTENEIATPAIVPSIKGHAQFATSNGIGWFRSDERITSSEEKGLERDMLAATNFEYGQGEDDWGMKVTSTPEDLKAVRESFTSKTRRILEVQSDLFQKGRDMQNLAGVSRLDNHYKIGPNPYGNKEEFPYAIIDTNDGEIHDFYKTQEEASKAMDALVEVKDDRANSFLQLLNKDNNWVTFFIKSIIQDSAKKGYEKVLFPVGDTAAKIEGHETLENLKTYTQNRIEELKKDREKAHDLNWIREGVEYEQEFVEYDENNPPREITDELVKRVQKSRIDKIDYELREKERELEDIKNGRTKISAINSFYETTVFNVLKKQGLNPKRITDEHGNEWYEIEIKPEQHLKHILLQKVDIEENPLVTEARNLSASVNGLYSILFREKTELALFEAAIQANSSASEKEGAIKAFGERIVEIAQELYPNAKVGDKFEDRNKQKSDGEKSEFSNKIVTLLDKLSLRFNIPYRLINDPEADFKGYFGVDGVVVINEAKVTKDTPFHEFLHPFILVLEQQNPTLYNALVKEIKTTKEGIAAVAQVMNKYPELTSNEQIHEAIVTYLGNLAAVKWDKKGSLFNRFFAWLKGFFKKVNINLSELSANTKLADIADMIVDEIFVSDLKQAIRNSNTLVRYSKPDRALTYESVFDKVKDKIMILDAIIKRRNKGDQFRQSIAELADIFEHADAVASINNFVANALHYVDKAAERFEKLRESVINPSSVNPKDVSHNIFVLNEIQQLLNVYQSLDDIQLLYYREGKLSSDDNMAKLGDAILKKNEIISDFKEFALTYTTEWLYPYIESTNKNVIAEGRQDLVISKEVFRDRLKMAMSDISAFGYWLGTTINSQDPISAAVGLALKDIVYDNQQKDFQTKNTLLKHYEDVRGGVKFATEASEEAFNAQFIREVVNYEQDGFDEDGKPRYKEVRRLAFHTEYLTDQFDKSRRELYKALGPEPNPTNKTAHKAWKKAESRWYRENTAINPDAANIIEERRRNMSKRQFDKWILENTKEVTEEVFEGGFKKSSYYEDKIYQHYPNKGTFRVYSGELVRPSAKWKNPEFNRLMQNPYYANLYKAYREANDKLGIYALKHGIIPQVPKNKSITGNISKNKNWKDNLKSIKERVSEKFSVDADSDERTVIERLDGTVVKKIPILFTGKIDTENLSTNLLESVLKFSQMANNYESMTEIEPNILLLKTVLNGDDNLGIKGREISQTNSKGIQKINAITKKLVPKAHREDMLNQRLNEFINDIVYGDEEILDSFNFLGREISLNKLSDKMGLITALQSMALNFNGGISNIIIGNFNNSIEAVGGRFFGKKDWMWAQKEYWKNVHEFLGEVGGVGTSEINSISEHYDVPQGEFQDQFGNRVTGGKVKNMFKTSSLFFIQKGGEHQIQITGMLSMMHATKVQTNDGREISLYDAWREFKTLEALSENTNWSKEDDKAFRNRLHSITKNLQGVYNKFDKSMLQRRWLGRLAIMFRKYMFSSFKARYGKEYVDYELGTVQQGYWNAALKKLKNEWKEYRWHMLTNMWTRDGYSEMERAAMNKTLYEFGIMLVAMVLAGFASLMDDEDDSWLSKELALQVTRFGADIKQFINPGDFIRVVRNPAAAVNMIEKWLDWFGQLITGPFEEYERSSGFADKGDSKLYIKTLKVLPVIRQAVNVMTPEEQLKFYNLTGGGK